MMRMTTAARHIAHTERGDRKGEKLNGFSIYTLKEFKFSSDLIFFLLSLCCRHRRRRRRLVEFRYESNNANIFLNRRTGLARHQWQPAIFLPSFVIRQ